MNLNPSQPNEGASQPDLLPSGAAGVGEGAAGAQGAASASAPAGPSLAEVDFVDHVFTYLLREFPHLAGPQFAKAKRAVREHLGGDRVYISRRTSEALAHQVLSLFNGRNASEVARSLNISRATVYRLLKQAPRRDGST